MPQQIDDPVVDFGLGIHHRDIAVDIRHADLVRNHLVQHHIRKDIPEFVQDRHRQVMRKGGRHLDVQHAARLGVVLEDVFEQVLDAVERLIHHQQQRPPRFGRFQVLMLALKNLIQGNYDSVRIWRLTALC